MTITVASSTLQIPPVIASQQQEYFLKPTPGTLAPRRYKICQTVSCAEKCSCLQSADLISPKYLIASPYEAAANLLDLTTLDMVNQTLAKALASFRPIRSDYATAPYDLSFNWDEILAALRKLLNEEKFEWNADQHFYVVQFRSQRRADADLELMGMLDMNSHREATQSGGLLKYWFGQVDGDRRNLATCVWRGPADAKKGGLGPWHQKARAATRTLYDSIDVKMRRLVIGKGAKTWRIEDW